MKFKELAEILPVNETLYIKVLDGDGDAVLNQFSQYSQYRKYVMSHSDFEVIALFAVAHGLHIHLIEPE